MINILKAFAISIKIIINHFNIGFLSFSNMRQES